MVADGTLYAHDGDVYWIDAGTPPTYLTANLDLVRGRRGAAEDGVDPTATVSGEVTESVVGAGATVEEGAIVSRSVLLPGATVRAGAIVADSIPGPRATHGRGAGPDRRRVGKEWV